MIVSQLVESILQSFPQVTRKQIILDLDTAQKNFVLETKFSRKTGSLSSISTNTGWTLPTDFYELVDVLCYDLNDNPVFLSDEDLAYEIEFGKFFIYSLTSTPITGVPASISTILIDYIYKPPTLSVETDSLSIDEEFSEALEAKVLSKYFAKFLTETLTRDGRIVKVYNLQSASYWNTQYLVYVMNAKKKINNLNKRSESDEGAKQYRFAGRFELPRRIKDSTSSTVVIGGITATYTKYLRIRVTDPSTVTELQTPIGYTITTYAYSSGTTLTIDAPSGTFSLTDTMISSSDPDFVRTTLTTSQIVIDWATAGTRTIEIYE